MTTVKVKRPRSQDASKYAVNTGGNMSDMMRDFDRAPRAEQKAQIREAKQPTLRAPQFGIKSVSMLAKRFGHRGTQRMNTKK